MLRKVLSTISLVATGFFLYGVILSAFLQISPLSIKLILMGIFLISMLLTLFIGLALRSFSRWQRVCGIVFLFTSAFCAFAFIMIVCILYTPEYKSIPEIHALLKTYALFNDLVSGIGLFSLILLTGAMLFYKGNSN